MQHFYLRPSAVPSLFCAFATVWQTSFTTLSSSTFESVNLSAPIQYRAKRQPRYFPNGMQYDTETILDFVFRGRGNWKLGWNSQFDLTSTCTYCMANLKKAKSEIAKWFSVVTGRECFVFDIRIPMKSYASTMHNKAAFDDTKSHKSLCKICSLWCK